MAETITDLASRMEELEGRLTGKGRADPWFLTWQLMVGTIHSLAQAKPLLRSSSREFTITRDNTLAVLRRIRGLPHSSTSHWELGYYLVSAELRVQSAMHRLLKTYARRVGKFDAFPIVNDILVGCANCRSKPPLSVQAIDILRGFKLDPNTQSRQKPGSVLRVVWDRGNAFKHNQRHTGRRRFSFQKRLRDATRALEEVAFLFEEMGTRRRALAAA